MDTAQLIVALHEAGVDERTFHIHGQVRSMKNGFIDGGAVLEPTDDERWVFGGVERGQFTPIRYFASEAEACAYVYAELTRPRPPLGPAMTAEDYEFNARIQADLKRETAERHARWLEQNQNESD